MVTIDSDPRGAVRELFYAGLASVPGADPAYEARRHGGRHAVTRDPTMLVVDGYPGSGNSWATRIVEIAGGWERPVAHHRHRPAQIIEGVRRRLPTLLVVREPLDAIASKVVRHGGNPRVELRRYDYFHARCWRVAERAEVITFAQATTDGGSIVMRLNARFDCRLTPLADLADDAEKQILGSLDWNAKLAHGAEAGLHSPTPSADRSEHLAAVREQLLDPRDAAALARCRRQYDRYAEVAARQAATAAG
jgi:hypothetical protein